MFILYFPSELITHVHGCKVTTKYRENMVLFC